MEWPRLIYIFKIRIKMSAAVAISTLTLFPQARILFYHPYHVTKPGGFRINSILLETYLKVTKFQLVLTFSSHGIKGKPKLSLELLHNNVEHTLWISLTFTEPNDFPFSHIESSSDANYHLRKLEAWVFLDNKMVKFSHYPALCSCSVCARKVWSSLKCRISG